MKSTNLLADDHRQILRVLNVLEEMAARVQRGEEPVETDVKRVVEFLEGFGDSHHQGREESVLFPALLRDRGQKNHRELSHMIFEHNRQRSLIGGIADSMLTRKRKDFVYYASHLVKILRTHLREEEDLLFPLIQATLSPNDDEGVVRDMTDYDRQWQERELSGLLRSLDNLESTYCRKALTAAATTAQ
jgi:hemerythrin-like domain-containing protein